MSVHRGGTGTRTTAMSQMFYSRPFASISRGNMSVNNLVKTTRVMRGLDNTNNSTVGGRLYPQDRRRRSSRLPPTQRIQGGR